MKASEIIKADAVKRKIDPDKALRTVSALVKAKSAVLMQESDSVVIIRKISPTSAETHLFTEDSPRTLAKAIITFVKRCKALGIKTLYGKADNQGIIELMKRVGLNVQASNLPKYNWMANI